jgi:hypothetical protein
MNLEKREMRIGIGDLFNHLFVNLLLFYFIARLKSASIECVALKSTFYFRIHIFDKHFLHCYFNQIKNYNIAQRFKNKKRQENHRKIQMSESESINKDESSVYDETSVLRIDGESPININFNSNVSKWFLFL